MADSRKFKFVSPGIFLNEIDQSERTDTGTPPGPVIIGRTERGPAMRPVVIHSFAEYVETFGNPMAGGDSEDVWRNGNYSAPTYGGFAAQAYLKNNAPVTVVRLAGQNHSKASSAEDAKAGWGSALDAGTSTAVGAYGLFVMQSGSSGDKQSDTAAQTGSLAAVWYMTDSSNTIALSGNFMRRNASGAEYHTASHACVLATSSANSSGEFVALIGTKTQIAANPPTAKRYVFNFNKDSENYIRNVFNTNPQKTNSDITATTENYWLGETFERSILDGARTNINSLNEITHGVLFGLATGGGDQWADRTRQAEVARSGWFVAQDTGDAANFNAQKLQKLFRLVGLDASGEWLQNNLKVSIQDIRPPQSQAPGVPQYGTFTVALRKIDDQDTAPNYVELFTSCDLNPNSSNFIARKIGDRYAEWDDDKKAYREFGKYANSSRFIRVELHPDVENGEGVGLLPFGFEGPPKLTDVGNESTGPAATALLSCADGDLASSGQFTEGEHVKMIATDGTVGIYILSDASETGAVASGTVLTATSDLGTGVPSTALLAAGTCIAVTCNLNTNSQATVLNEFKDTIASTNSPLKDKITGGTITGTGDGLQSITFTQVTAGSSGNTAITTDISQFTETDFSGGGMITTAGHVGANDFILTNDESFLPNSDADNRDYSTDFAAITHNGNSTGAMALTASYRFPSPVLRFASNQAGSNFLKPQQPYFGIDVALSGSTKYDRGTPDLLRATPASLVTYTVGSNDTSSGRVVPSHIFTLDNLVVPGSASLDFTIAKYVSGSRTTIDGVPSVTALSGASFLLTASNYGYNKFTTVFHGGFDGLDVTEADPFRNTFIGSSPTETNNYAFYSVKKAIDTVRDPEVVECNMLLAPGITNTVLTDHMISTCEDRADTLAIIDLENDYIPAHDTSLVESAAARRPNVDSAVYTLKNRKLNSSYAAAYYPYVQIRDTLSNRILAVPPSVVALGAISYSESARELWFAPAGFTRGGLSDGNAGLTVLGTKHHLTSEERDDLYAVNVNPIASFPAEGVVIFGQKTLQATTSALDRINVRRLLIHVKKEVSRIAATTLFEQNVATTWDGFASEVDTFLNNIKAGLGLTDYKIVLDETTTTPDLVDRNIMYAKIFLKPAQAIEFIALDFIITDSGASFAD